MTKDSMISKSSKNVFRILGGSTSSPATEAVVQKTVLSNSKTSSSCPIVYKTSENTSFSSIPYQKNVLKSINNRNQLQKDLFINNGKKFLNIGNSAQPNCLSSLLVNESKFNNDISHVTYVNSLVDERVDGRLREKALLDLLSLHQAFYNLDSVTFAKSVCLLDTFMNKIKFKPKYIMCVTAACYYIASKFENSPDAFHPTRDNLIRLYRCPGTKEDLTRMIDIILNKLSPEFITSIRSCNSTSANFLEKFFEHINSSQESTPDYDPILKSFSRKIELMLCSPSLTKFRPSCQALSLLYGSCLKDNDFLERIDNLNLLDVLNLAHACQVDWSDIEECFAIFKPILRQHSNLSKNYQTSDNHFFPASGSSQESNLFSSNFSGSPPIRWNLSRRTRISMDKFASVKPKLASIVEDKSELELHNLYTTELQAARKHSEKSPPTTDLPQIPLNTSPTTNQNRGIISTKDSEKDNHQSTITANVPIVLSQKIKSLSDGISDHEHQSESDNSSILCSTKYKIHSTLFNKSSTGPAIAATHGAIPNAHLQLTTENFFNSPFQTNYNQLYDEINDSICGLLTPLLIA